MNGKTDRIRFVAEADLGAGRVSYEELRLDNGLVLGSRPAGVHLPGSPWISAQVTLAAPFAVADTTNTAVVWDLEQEDLGGCVDLAGQPTRITATLAGLYTFSFNPRFPSGAAAHNYRAWILHSGGAILADDGRYAFLTPRLCPPICRFRMAAGEYVEAWVWHDVGAAVNVEIGSLFCAHRLGD